MRFLSVPVLPSAIATPITQRPPNAPETAIAHQLTSATNGMARLHPTAGTPASPGSSRGLHTTLGESVKSAVLSRQNQERLERFREYQKDHENLLSLYINKAPPDRGDFWNERLNCLLIQQGVYKTCLGEHVDLRNYADIWKSADRMANNDPHAATSSIAVTEAEAEAEQHENIHLAEVRMRELQLFCSQHPDDVMPILQASMALNQKMNPYQNGVPALHRDLS